ncbi:hypothetical protein QF032_002626 [Streptomyces achromogenes]|nr:hypothetical protein [Streptomyces achromogenes]
MTLKPWSEAASMTPRYDFQYAPLTVYGLTGSRTVFAPRFARNAAMIRLALA